MSAARRHALACTGFWLWALPGALLTLAVLTVLSIGAFVLPFAAASLAVVSRRERRRGSIGLLGGAGATIAAIGLLHLTDSQFDPYPWLYVGGVILVASLVLFGAGRRRAS